MADEQTQEEQQGSPAEEQKAEETVEATPAEEPSSPPAGGEKPAKAPVKEAPKAEEKKEVDTSKLTDKAKKVMDDVSGMSVLELAELVKVLEDKFGVSAAPVAVSSAVQQNAGAAEEEKSAYNINLVDAGSNKIGVIKAVREVTELGLKEAKDLVEGAPKMVRENVKKAEAEEIKKKLEAAGAKVELQ